MIEIDDTLYTRCMISIRTINLTEKKFEILDYLNTINMQQCIATFFLANDNCGICASTSYRHINTYDGDVVVAQMIDAFGLAETVHKEVMKIVYM